MPKSSGFGGCCSHKRFSRSFDQAPKDRRKQAAGTPRTGSLFDTPDNPEEEEPGKEMPQIREADMKPRPFEGEVAPYFREGTLVTDGQNRVGCSFSWIYRVLPAAAPRR